MLHCQLLLLWFNYSLILTEISDLIFTKHLTEKVSHLKKNIINTLNLRLLAYLPNSYIHIILTVQKNSDLFRCTILFTFSAFDAAWGNGKEWLNHGCITGPVHEQSLALLLAWPIADLRRRLPTFKWLCDWSKEQKHELNVVRVEGPRQGYAEGKEGVCSSTS